MITHGGRSMARTVRPIELHFHDFGPTAKRVEMRRTAFAHRGEGGSS
jgi:hypothetical protein